MTLIVAMVTGMFLGTAVPVAELARPMTTDEARAEVVRGVSANAPVDFGLPPVVPFTTDDARAAAGAERGARAATPSAVLRAARIQHGPTSTDEARAAASGA